MSLPVSSHSRLPNRLYFLRAVCIAKSEIQMKIRYLQSLSQKLLLVSLAFQTKAFKKQFHQYREKLRRNLLIKKHQN